jgi:hypothetical protein
LFFRDEKQAVGLKKAELFLGLNKTKGFRFGDNMKTQNAQ